jgi:hypothetical protein
VTGLISPLFFLSPAQVDKSSVETGREIYINYGNKGNEVLTYSLENLILRFIIIARLPSVHDSCSIVFGLDTMYCLLVLFAIFFTLAGVRICCPFFFRLSTTV